MAGWSNDGGGMGSGTIGLRDVFTIMQNGVTQLGAIAKALTSMTASNAQITLDAVELDDTAPVGYMQVVVGGRTVILQYREKQS